MAKDREDAKTTKTRGRWWWIDKWRRSSAFIEMTLAEQGAYHNLLDEQRLRGGLIPNDERILARACGDPLEWPNIRDKLLRWFQVTEDGKHLYNVTARAVNAATDALSESAAIGGRARAEAARQRKAQRSGSDSHSDPAATVQAEGAAVDQPPLSVVRNPLSVSVVRSPLSGRTEDGTELVQAGDQATDEPPPTTATPAEARAKALDRLGPKDCIHPALAARQPIRRTTVCPDCREEIRPAEKPNPFLAEGGRDAWELEAMKLTRDIGALRQERERAGEHLADDEPVDGAEIFAMAAHYEGAAPGRTKCNPASLRDDRLVNTVLDLRATLKAEQAKRRSA